MKDTEAFRKSLRMMRRHAGVTQEQLAQVLGVSRPLIAKIEMGSHGVSLDVALGVARFFDTTVEDLCVDWELRPVDALALAILNPRLRRATDGR